jgi:hypothetical protein
VVVNEMCRALGYKGLLLVVDEAEHVRGYNVRRQERANNFFDLLARCAHRPLKGCPRLLSMRTDGCSSILEGGSAFRPFRWAY